MRKRAWGERSLDPTGLVNEAVVRLLADPRVRNHTDRRYVFAAALHAMRRVLVDRAKARKRLKRGGGRVQIRLDDVADQVVERLEAQEVDVEALDQALEKLAAWDPRLAEVVSMRFLLNMKISAIAKHRGCCISTVENDLFDARAWLRRELGREMPGSLGAV
jgi:RNA polymerase sigma factor (TIGR02999 family)